MAEAIKPAYQGKDQLQKDAPQQPLSKLRISKKAFVFDVKRKYSANRTFAVKRKPETPGEDFKETLQSLFRKTPSFGAEGGKQSEIAKALSSPKASSGMLPIAIKVMAGISLLFILGIAFLYLQFSGAKPFVPEEQPPGAFFGFVDFRVINSMLLNSNERTEEGGNAGWTSHIIVDYEAQNLSELNFTAGFFSERPRTQLFILDYPRDSAYNYPLFRGILLQKLSSQGMSANEIDASALHSLPGGAILLVPTGYFPSVMLEPGSPANYKSLLERGVDIIYIGLPFDTHSLEQGGQIITISNNELKFGYSGPASAPGFWLFDPKYTVSSSTVSGLSAAGTLYGSVSLLKSKSGVMLFLPQSLDAGWIGDDVSSGPDKAAEDVARIISEQQWIKPFASSFAVALPRAKDEDGNKSVATLFSNQFAPDSAFIKLVADMKDDQGIKRREVDILRTEKAQLGEITVRDSRAVPYYLSGLRTRINLMLRENSTAPVKLYVAMFKDGEELQRTDLELGLTNPTTEKSIDFTVNAPPGEYVISVIDAQGKVYAATKLDVIGLDIKANSTKWELGSFTFLLSSGGKPVNPTSLTVEMDGKGLQRYSQSNMQRTPSASALQYVSRDAISQGTHTFTFTAGDWQEELNLEYRKAKNFWENPLVIALGIVSLGIFGIGTFLRRPEALRYGLDIPDFPPISTIKIPLKRETALAIFNNVNLGYSWKWMPLRAEEIKAGLRKLTYNGKPIIVGDFNLERVLSKLKDEGLVKSELDYWGQASWEAESGHTMRYLAIYRILRNVFVNNAVRFSRMDAMPDCDVKAIAGKEEVYLHIMDGEPERVAHRAIATAKKNTSIIVFLTDEEVEEFTSSLTSTSKLAVGLKMEVQNRNIMLLPVKIAVSTFLKQRLA